MTSSTLPIPVSWIEAGPFSLAVWDDGVVQVVADQERTLSDWERALCLLDELGTEPLGVAKLDGEYDVWTTRLEPVA